MLQAIIIFLIVIGIVTLVGHGIWVLLAKLIRLGMGEPKPPSSMGPVPAQSRCPRCQVPLESHGNQCMVCNWPGPLVGNNNPDEALNAIYLQLQRFEQLGIFQRGTHERLVASVLAERMQLASELAESLERPPSVPIRATAPPVCPEVIEIPKTQKTRPAAPIEAPLPIPTEPGFEESATPPATVRELSEQAAARAREYATRRAGEAAKDQAAASLAARTPPSPPRKPFAAIFAAFMEEKNIRWGELIGGMLIICGSIALVISFWSQIAERPFLKFFLFNGVTAALFGVGFYTFKRWKLQTTSRGILITAALLVPLNFLAIAALTTAADIRTMASVGLIAGEIFSIGLFATLILYAARILLPDLPWLATIGVMVPSVMQLVIRRWIEPSVGLPIIYILAIVPILSYLAASGWHLLRLRRADFFDERAANSLFLLIGICSYALLLPLGLLLYKTGSINETLHWLAPLIPLIGAPSMAIGLLCWRRITDPILSGIRTAGLSIGVLGALIFAGSALVAWPDPLTLLPVIIIHVIVFTAIALLFELPQAHLLAGLSLIAAWLVAFHALAGHVDWNNTTPRQMLAAFFSAASGTACVPLAAILGGVVLFWNRMRRREDALMYGIVLAAVIAISLGLVTWFGFRQPGDPHHVVWIYAFYTMAALAVAWATNHPAFGWAASLLLLAAVVQTVVYRLQWVGRLIEPWSMALLLHATIAILIGSLARFWQQGRAELALESGIIKPSTESALATSIVGLGIITPGILGLSEVWTVTAISGNVFWMAALWLALAILRDWRNLFAAFQVLLVVALTFGVAAMVTNRGWYQSVRSPWLDPWFIQAVGIACAIYCIFWTAARIGLRFLSTPASGTSSSRAPSGWFLMADRFLNPPGLPVDRGVAMGLVVFLILVAAYAAIPGIAQELAPRTAAVAAGTGTARTVIPASSFALAGIPHNHASGTGAWLLVVAVAGMLFVGMWERASCWRWIGFLLVAASVCPLLAASFEPHVATASAMRWVLAAFFVIVSVPIWFRGRIVTWSKQIGWSQYVPDVQGTNQSISDMIRSVLLAIQIIPLVMMGIYVVVSSLRLADIPPQILNILWCVGPITLIMAVGVLFLRGMPSMQTKWMGRFDHRVSRAGIASDQAPVRTRAHFLVDIAFLISAGSFLTAIFFAVADALKKHPVTGPEPNTWFHEMGWAVSYVVPLVTLAAVFVGHAIRERNDRYAFAAGLLLDLGATVAYAFTVPVQQGAVDGSIWIQIAQINTVISAGYALLWYAAIRWYSRRHQMREDRIMAARSAEFAAETGTHNLQVVENSHDPLPARATIESACGLVPTIPQLLGTQVALTVAICGLSILPAAFGLVIDPAPDAWVLEAAHWLGWLGLSLTVLALAWTRTRMEACSMESFLGTTLSVLGPMTALTIARWDVGGAWLGYHGLLVAIGVSAWFMVGVGSWGPRSQRLVWQIRSSGNAAIWSTAFGITTIVLAFRGLGQDPADPWWTVGGLVAMAGLGAGLAAQTARRIYIYSAGLFFNIAVSIWWLDLMWGSGGFEVLIEFLLINILALAAPVIGWVVLDRRYVQPGRSVGIRGRGLGFHRVAGSISVAMMFFTVLISLLAHRAGWPSSANSMLGWVALVVTGIAILACLWDAATRFAVTHLYLLGLAGAGWMLDCLNLQGDLDLFDWSLTLILAAYALGTSYLWSRRGGMWELATRWGAPARDGISGVRDPDVPAISSVPIRPGLGWMVSANMLLAILVTLSALRIELSFDGFHQRMLASYAVFAQAFAIGLLAKGVARSMLQLMALVYGVLGGIAFGFAWLPIDIVSPLLHRMVVITVALAALIVLYGFGFSKLLRRENEWTRAATRLVPLLAGLAAIALLVVLGLEAAQYIETGKSVILWPAILAVAIGVAGLALAALAAAVLPGRDPFGLSERGRQVYVYVAEVLLGLLFVHIRITMPFLFKGWFVQFWPIIVMVIAFIGVGLSEWFRSRRQQVLSQPLERTGALLPLLPVIGFWVLPNATHYSLTLLAVGALYSALAALRKSFLFAILAALAANGSLWYLLYRADGLGLAEHPQLWLIPPALCVLAASYINRRQLTDVQMTTIRYLASIVIYVSSTADVFLIGVADAPWLPLILAAVSIIGIFAGIGFRIRAFLYLGTAFLLVALFTYIWYAAVDLEQTWIWWVTTIVMGALIITVFAIFEKKRDDVLRLVDELRRWDA